MGKLIVLIGILVFCGIILALPLYLAVNLVCLAFHLSFHLTLFQAFSLCLCGSVIYHLLFGNKEEK